MNNLDVLEENLKNKYEVMQKINNMNITFEKNLQNTEDFNVESLEEYLDNKEILINNLESLEEETINIFESIKDIKNLKENEKIRDIKDILEKIQELSNNLVIKEKQTKKQVELFLSNERALLNINKKTSVAAFNYYKTMNKFGNVMPQFFDKKTD